MANLIRTRPLAGRAATDAAPKETSAVTLRELPYLALTNLRVQPAAADSLKEDLDLALPVQANTTFENAAGLRALWLGPDEWLIQSNSQDGDALTQSLSKALENIHHSAKNVSDNFTSLRLEGPKTRQVLAKLTPFDVHRSVFSAGQCAQTVMAKTNVILDMVSDEDEAGLCLDLSVRRSFAAYLWDRLIDAGLEFNIGVHGAETA